MTYRSFAVAFAFGASGCGSSSYRPANSPIVSEVYEGGTFVYYRGDKKCDRLLDAVDGNPRAVAEARTARARDTWGTGIVWSGVGMEVAGFVMIGAGENDTVKTAGGGLVVAALGA